MVKAADLENKIDLLSLVKEKHEVTNIGHEVYRVNPCPVCNGNDHFTIYANENSYCSFSTNKCCKGGSIYKYLIEVEGMEENQVMDKLKYLAGASNSEPRQDKKTKVAPEEAPEQDFTDYILEAYKKQGEKGKTYFLKRGISAQIVDKYRLCTIYMNGTNRAVFPSYKKGVGSRIISYDARAIEDNVQPKYKKNNRKYEPFNKYYLHTEKGEVIFLTEGPFDALSLESLGYKAISTGGLTHYNKIKKEIEKKANIYIGAFDTDTAGDKLKESVKIPHLAIPDKYKDINEWFMTDKEDIEKSIKDQLEGDIKTQMEELEQLTKKPNNTLYYLNNKFDLDINKFSSNKNRKTGFNNLDEKLKGLHSGLYVIGGISSVGKTTFAHQIADQIAQQGEGVLYFSLEQSTFELVSKSLSRITNGDNFKGSPVSSFNIRCGNTDTNVKKALEEYKQTADKISIIEGNFNNENTTTKSIKTITEEYIKANKKKPVLFIDYLQIMQGSDPRLSDKQKTDQNVTALKRMSRDLDVAVFVISSLNRTNYTKSIDFESFKESGGIEYTADVVLGLQLDVFKNPIFESEGYTQKKRELVNDAKEDNPRKIELVCLKNRNGEPYFKCKYEYYPEFDTFTDNEEKQTSERITF